MLKLVKYELIGKSRNILGGIAALVLLNIFVEIGFNFWWKGGAEASFVCSVLLGTIAFVCVGIDIISLLRRDLFGNTGYLVFTLPRSGYSILGAKLIAGLVELVAFTIVQSLIGAYYLAFRLNGFDIAKLMEIFPDALPVIFNVILTIGSGFLVLLLMITFSLVLARSLFTRKKFGKLISFGIFLGLTYIIGILENGLQSLFHHAPLQKTYEIGSGTLSLDWVSGIDIAFLLVISAVLFFISGYLLEKRLEV